MINNIPLIYLELIYSNLSYLDLTKLGSTCKTIYSQDIRKDILVLKVCKTFGYSSDKNYSLKNYYTFYCIVNFGF